MRRPNRELNIEEVLNGKSKEEKLVYLHDLPYEIILKKNEKGVTLIIPELSMVSIDKDISLAYQDITNQKDKLFKKLLDGDALNSLILPNKIQEASRLWIETKVFACKLLIVCLLLGGVFLGVGVTLINKVTNISGSSVAKKIIREAIDEVESINNLSPEIKQDMINKLKKIVVDFRPIFEEFKGADISTQNKNKK